MSSNIYIYTLYYVYIQFYTSISVLSNGIPLRHLEAGAAWPLLRDLVAADAPGAEHPLRGWVTSQLATVVQHGTA